VAVCSEAPGDAVVVSTKEAPETKEKADALAETRHA
jgi:hypothetical protein